MSKEEKIAIYPGSFDPITKGHLDILQRAGIMFDKVVIALLKNSSKKSFLPIEDRVKLIKESVIDMKNVEVAYFGGLTVEYAKQIGARFLIRGLRAVSDFEYEMQLSQANMSIAPDIETVFFITKPEYNFISSGIVKELASYGKDISNFVPKAVSEYFENKLMKG